MRPLSRRQFLAGTAAAALCPVLPMAVIRPEPAWATLCTTTIYGHLYERLLPRPRLLSIAITNAGDADLDVIGVAGRPFGLTLAPGETVRTAFDGPLPKLPEYRPLVLAHYEGGAVGYVREGFGLEPAERDDDGRPLAWTVVER